MVIVELRLCHSTMPNIFTEVRSVVASSDSLEIVPCVWVALVGTHWQVAWHLMGIQGRLRAYDVLFPG